jgi:hypothetical protein
MRIELTSDKLISCTASDDRLRQRINVKGKGRALTYCGQSRLRQTALTDGIARTGPVKVRSIRAILRVWSEVKSTTMLRLTHFCCNGK